jgi:hypothetical protein
MQPILHGTHEGYSWVTSADTGLRELLRAVPELVLGRVVAITSFDSGPLRPTVDRLAAGWATDGDVAVSPPIGTIDEVPFAGWDEMYVLSRRVLLAEPDVFVNYEDFSPNPVQSLGDLDPALSPSDAQDVLQGSLGRTMRFWRQLLRLQPRAFLADGTLMTCVVQDEQLFRRVLLALAESGDK